MKSILILKFPHRSFYGSRTSHVVQMVDELQKKEFKFFLVSSCPILLREFRKRKWPAQRSWGGVEPVSRLAGLAWVATFIFALINLCGLLLYYRVRYRINIVYCLSLSEKIVATLPARMLGMKVFWAEDEVVEGKLGENPFRIFYRLFSRYVTIIAVSRIVARQLTTYCGVAAERIQVVYYGVDLRKFKMKEYRWENAARYNIGCVARLETIKGIEFLIQAVKLVKEFVPFIRLIIVGEGAERRKLVWLSERLGLKESVQWIGQQKEIEKWYGFFDVYVLPSVALEAFGMTVVEAMACGIPVIASRLGGVPEIVEHKKTGLLAKPGSSQDLADQLIYLFNNRSLVREMVLAAYERVTDQFSLERMVRDYYLLFRK